MTTENTALTVTERAAVALGAKAYEIALVDLVAESARIREIKNKGGYDEAHSARMRLKGARIEISKTGKAAREDAQAFSKAVIAEEKRLIDLIEPEESRLQTLQDAWDAEREAERAAKAAAEQARIDGHRAGIDAIKAFVLQAYGQPSGEVRRLIDSLLLTYTRPDFEEFQPAAEKAKAETLAALQDLHDVSLAREAKLAQMEAERIERERRQAEAAAKLNADREAFEAQQAEARRLQVIEDAKRAEQERIARDARQAEESRLKAIRDAEQAKIDAERAELRRQQEAIAADQRRLQEAAKAAERAKAEEAAAKARAEAEEKRRQEEAEAAHLRRIEDEKRQQADLVAQRTRAIRDEIDSFLDQMTDAELLEVLNFVQIEVAHAEAA